MPRSSGRHGGMITFGAVGFIQTFLVEPVLVNRQSLSYH
jgi:hypothetical protein